ncbi:hypothetical protein, partial [Paracoccus sp. (in: a-proteobacteria)]|uniref:hypothetical protein n=1 Tax=Paracoccus sp. TaxID=267 RepID=UPI0026E03D36
MTQESVTDAKMPPPVGQVTTDEQHMHHSSDPPPPARPSGFALIVVYILGAAGVLMAINQVFLLDLFGFQPLGNSYLYYLIGIFLSIAFITMPSSPKWAASVPWF